MRFGKPIHTLPEQEYYWLIPELFSQLGFTLLLVYTPAMEPIKSMRSCEFGYAAAEEEGAFRPELLLAGYHDPEHLIASALGGRRFLFLGYKGTGKSAIGEHLRLLATQEPNLFVELITLADFPFGPFKKIIKGDDADDTKYPSAWSWLLLVHFLEMFRKDNGGEFSEPDVVNKVYSVLEELALLPNPDFKKSVLTSSKNSFGAKFNAVTASRETTSEPQTGADLLFFIDRLKKTTYSFKTESRHLLVIDGLDDILTKKSIQLDALAALIFQANQLNRGFAIEGLSAKVVILCRTDLFERLPGTNTNKLRQDAAVNLDWYRDTKEPGKSDLIKLINRRASLSAGDEIDVFSSFLPSKIRRNAHGDEQPTTSFPLDLTRHTPRDLIVLMTKIKEFADREVLTRDLIMKGVAEYSKDYFLPEIKNELSGYVSEAATKWVLGLVGALRKREFTVGDLVKHAETMPSPDIDKLVEILTYLFECSAIGNVDMTPTGNIFFTFRYRNRHSSFSPTKKIVLHFGMWKAFNLV